MGFDRIVCKGLSAAVRSIGYNAGGWVCHTCRGGGANALWLTGHLPEVCKYETRQQ